MLGLFHFGRRVLECLFVHIYSNVTIPLSEFLESVAHYWGLFGVLTCYFMLYPTYEPPALVRGPLYYVLVLGFAVAELLNLCCHFVLLTLRAPGQYHNGIPWVR